MHVIPPAPRITLSRGAVCIGVFATLQDVGRYLGMATVRDLVYRQRDEALAAPWYAADLPTPPGLVVRDGDDVAVSWYQVLRACRELERRRKSRDRFETWNGAGPVPGTGRRKHYRFMRRPRTSQELRLAAGVVFEEDEPEWRARRRNVPTVYDDIILHRDHNWKRHRRTRWK